MSSTKKERLCIECGKRIPPSRVSRAITCSIQCSNKRATTTASMRKRSNIRRRGI